MGKLEKKEEGISFKTPAIADALAFYHWGTFTVRLLFLGHNWLKKETWYLIREQKHSLLTEKRTSNESCQGKLSTLKFGGFLEHIASELENRDWQFSFYVPILFHPQL